ncbi:LytTR family DNA-binding domain-containing protein [Gramella sp. KN1008]|uniref:LytR/AlgR family response regulator transcription factor n=1 Tax=Gramella sp. KN1008 TaxID=2529298 RepID=UPI00103F2CFD|nr:LytTR family DNA-binding domain-containing protein [Gramella sp. KN1008]TBW25906.1 response regulator transcription factor [Gramella sp. KN1008]
MRTSLIIDDEIFARERVKEFLQYSDFKSSIIESHSGKDAIDKINKSSPSLIFLDLDLQDMSGFDVLDNSNLDYKPIIICITASEIDAITAYEYQITDYLLKPYTLKRFKTSINRVKELIDLKNGKTLVSTIQKLTSIEKTYSDKIPVKKKDTTQLIDLSSVLYFSSDQHYIELVLSDHKHLIRESMQKLEQKLDPNQFIRIYRSTIININFIEEIIHCDYSDIQIRMTNSEVLKVGRSYKKQVIDFLGI